MVVDSYLVALKLIPCDLSAMTLFKLVDSCLIALKFIK